MKNNNPIWKKSHLRVFTKKISGVFLSIRYYLKNAYFQSLIFKILRFVFTVTMTALNNSFIGKCSWDNHPPASIAVANDSIIIKQGCAFGNHLRAALATSDINRSLRVTMQPIKQIFVHSAVRCIALILFCATITHLVLLLLKAQQIRPLNICFLLLLCIAAIVGLLVQISWKDLKKNSIFSRFLP